MGRRLTSTLIAVLTAITSLGMSTLASSPSPSSGIDSPDPLVLVAIGDSVPFNLPNDCPGCTGFVDSYAAWLEEATGRPVEAHNRSRHDGARARDIASQLERDQELIALLGTADVVIISAGLNDGPPFVDQDAPCYMATPNETNDEYFAAVRQVTPECMDEALPALANTLSTVLARVRELAPEARIGALDAYDSWNGWAGLTATDDQELIDDVAATIGYWLGGWSTALCEETPKVDAVCVGIYRAFNGPDGRTLSGSLLAADYSHPSQAGNDLIRDVLIESGLAEGIVDP